MACSVLRWKCWRSLGGLFYGVTFMAVVGVSHGEGSLSCLFLVTESYSSKRQEWRQCKGQRGSCYSALPDDSLSTRGANSPTPYSRGKKKTVGLEIGRRKGTKGYMLRIKDDLYTLLVGI